MFQKYMEFKAKNEAKEVAAFSVKGGNNHIVQPWDKNTSEESINNKTIVKSYGYNVSDIDAQYHTHPGYSGASSWKDAKYSSSQGFPVYSVGNDGVWWKANQSIPSSSVLEPRNTNPPMLNWGSRLKGRP